MLYEYIMTNIITVLSKLKCIWITFFFCILHLFCFVFLSFIDVSIACVNTAVKWTCPGGYIQVHKAIWTMVHELICTKTSTGKPGEFTLTKYMTNKCDNKTSCDFTVNDSTFNVSCTDKCSGLSYTYECVSKSSVLRIF